MRKIDEILRLRIGLGLSERQVARSCQVSRNTVKSYVQRFEELGLNWPLPEDTNIHEVFSPFSPTTTRPLPDWNDIHREMSRKGVTLKLLWEEFKAKHSQSYQYTQFAVLYRNWLKHQKLTMRQVHKAGEKLFVDFAGQTIPVDDPDLGSFEAAIFIATLGASHYTYVEAMPGQDKESWLTAHAHTFSFLGGVPEIVIPDNLKSGVTRPCRYEPDLNPSYQDLATHYQTAVLPARIKKPRDKAPVENAVLIVERWILARLRNHRFQSLYELNQHLKKLLITYNEKPFQKRPGSRKSEFLNLEQEALKPLPSVPYEFAEWKQVKTHVDYHIEVDRKYYSVPYRHHGQTLDARITRNTIEIFHQGKRLAGHPRLYGKQRFSTRPEHMPPQHQWVSEWSPQRFLKWAADIGINTRNLIKLILNKRHPVQQSYRSCLGILSLAKPYGPERLERACQRALHFGGDTYRSVKSILEKGLDQRTWQGEGSQEAEEPPHENLRGAAYYERGTSC